MPVTPNAVVLKLNKVTGFIEVSDNTDYAAQGIDFNAGDTIYGLIQLSLVVASGLTQVLYANTNPPPVDIDPSTSPDNTQPIALPLDADGKILPGMYLLTYTIFGEYAIGGTFTGTFQTQQIYDYTLPEIALEKEVKCDTSQLASKDITDYGPYAAPGDISRVHTIYPPPASGKTLSSSALPLLIYNNITTKTWTQEVVSTVLFKFNDNFQVYATLKGSDEIKVECSTDVCTALCCINKRINGYNWTKKYNPAAAQTTFETVIMPAYQLMVQFLLAQYCGKNASDILAELKAVTGCSGECNDCGDVPISIIPTSPAVALEYNVDSPDNSIAVDTEVIGNVTTFHIQIAEIIQNIISNFVPIDVIGGTNITVPAPTMVGGKLTFVINTTGVSTAPLNRYYARGRIYHNPLYLTPGQPQFLFEADEISIDVAKFKTPTFGFGNTVPNALTDFAVLGVSDFFAIGIDADTKYVAQANVMQYTNGSDISYVKDTEAEVFLFDLATPSFTIRLWNPSKSGAPLRLLDLSTVNDIYIQISIHAV